MTAPKHGDTLWRVQAYTCPYTGEPTLFTQRLTVDIPLSSGVGWWLRTVEAIPMGVVESHGRWQDLDNLHTPSADRVAARTQEEAALDAVLRMLRTLAPAHGALSALGKADLPQRVVSRLRRIETAVDMLEEASLLGYPSTKEAP